MLLSDTAWGMGFFFVDPVFVFFSLWRISHSLFLLYLFDIIKVVVSFRRGGKKKRKKHTDNVKLRCIWTQRVYNTM